MAACPAAAASGESLIQSAGFRLPGAAFLVFTSCFCAACNRQESDGGVKEMEQSLPLVGRTVASLQDPEEPRRVRHGANESRRANQSPAFLLHQEALDEPN